MHWLFYLAAGVVLLFGLAVLVGAPYLPTLKPQVAEALRLLDLDQGQTLLELGSGDGRLLKAAAQKGIRAVGYEINPLLVLFSILYTWRYRHMVRVHWQNYWLAKLPPANGIYVFLRESMMHKLHNKIIQEQTTPVKVVSFAFEIADKKPVKTSKGLFLYQYR